MQVSHTSDIVISMAYDLQKSDISENHVGPIFIVMMHLHDRQSRFHTAGNFEHAQKFPAIGHGEKRSSLYWPMCVFVVKRSVSHHCVCRPHHCREVATDRMGDRH